MKKSLDIKERPYDISVVVPVFNEAESIRELYDQVAGVLGGLGKSFEIIFVDDGSTDSGAAVVEGIASGDSRVKLVVLARNFGQTAAMSAGFTHARGRIYVAMDADLQNDPSDIPMLLEKMGEGYDVVSGWRRDRKDPLVSRRIPSVIANRILSLVTGVKLRDYGCSLKAYRAEFIDPIELYGEMHRFIPAYAAMVGARVAEMPVNHRARVKGKSKYGLARIFKVLMDLMTVKFLSSWATKPSYLFGGIGSVLCLAGVLAAIEVITEKFASGTFAHKNPFLLLAVFLFFLGVQLVLMGLIAELLVRTYHESQGKPVYLVKRTVNVGHAA